MKLQGSQHHFPVKIPLFPLLASLFSFIWGATDSWSSCQEFGCKFNFVNISVRAFLLKILLCNPIACKGHSQPVTGKLCLWRLKGWRFFWLEDHMLWSLLQILHPALCQSATTAGNVKINVCTIFKQSCLWTFKTCMLCSRYSTFVCFITNHMKIEKLIFCHNYTTGDKLLKNIFESFEKFVLIILTPFPNSSMIQTHQPLCNFFPLFLLDLSRPNFGCVVFHQVWPNYHGLHS